MSLSIPNVILGEFGYEGKISLSVWDEYLTDLNGIYNFDICGDMVEVNPSILNEHVVAYNYMLENQNEIKEAIIDTLFKRYSELQMDYGYEDDEAEEFMPDVVNPEKFKELIGLSRVHIMNVYKDGIAYVGYEFTCTWDEEHGFGVMTHKDRVVNLGGADVSFLTWIAKDDIKKDT